jgi:RNA polymerase sigma-70 factor, ECF subfamily
VLLCKFESMSYEEIAQSMEMTPQAIKSLLSRARANLRDVLEPYLQTGLAHPVETSPKNNGEQAS